MSAPGVSLKPSHETLGRQFTNAPSGDISARARRPDDARRVDDRVSNERGAARLSCLGSRRVDTRAPHIRYRKWGAEGDRVGSDSRRLFASTACAKDAHGERAEEIAV
jgi:hypothetical protein